MPSKTTNPSVLWPYRGPERWCWYVKNGNRQCRDLAAFVSGRSNSGNSVYYCKHHAQKNASHGWFSIVQSDGILAKN